MTIARESSFITGGDTVIFCALMIRFLLVSLMNHMIYYYLVVRDSEFYEKTYSVLGLNFFEGSSLKQIFQSIWR